VCARASEKTAPSAILHRVVVRNNEFLMVWWWAGNNFDSIFIRGKQPAREGSQLARSSSAQMLHAEGTHSACCATLSAKSVCGIVCIYFGSQVLVVYLFDKVVGEVHRNTERGRFYSVAYNTRC
jgi:hypothetical protein